MDLYYTDFEDADVLRRNDARSVMAWMRAAAYAAGDDPDAVLDPATGDSTLGPDSMQEELDFLR